MVLAAGCVVVLPQLYGTPRANAHPVIPPLIGKCPSPSFTTSDPASTRGIRQSRSQSASKIARPVIGITPESGPSDERARQSGDALSGRTTSRSRASIVANSGPDDFAGGLL